MSQVVELFGGEEVIVQDCGWEGRVGGARGDGEERGEGGGEVG